MFTFSDAWFLSTLLGDSNWLSLKQVITAGDCMNHAIFTKDEINQSLSLFIALDYVEINSKKQMRSTKKAQRLCNVSFWLAGACEVPNIILKQLNKSTASNENYPITEYFSDSEMENM